MEKELEKMREECAKLRKKVKDCSVKLSKISSGALHEADGDDDMDGADAAVAFEKLCDNDKVIKTIKDLIVRTEKEKSERDAQQKDLVKKLQIVTEKVREFNEQIEYQETKDRQVIKDMDDEIKKRQESAGNTKGEKDEYKQWEKKMLKEKNDIMQS